MKAKEIYNEWVNSANETVEEYSSERRERWEEWVDR